MRNRKCVFRKAGSWHGNRYKLYRRVIYWTPFHPLEGGLVTRTHGSETAAGFNILAPAGYPLVYSDRAAAPPRNESPLRYGVERATAVGWFYDFSKWQFEHTFFLPFCGCGREVDMKIQSAVVDLIGSWKWWMCLRLVLFRCLRDCIIGRRNLRTDPNLSRKNSNNGS